MNVRASRKVWTERVAAWRASGKSMAAFAEGQPYRESTLCNWERTLRLGRPTKHRALTVREASVATMGARAKPIAVPMARVVTTPRELRAEISVEVSGARVVVTHGFDVRLLREVVAALQAER